MNCLYFSNYVDEEKSELQLTGRPVNLSVAVPVPLFPTAKTCQEVPDLARVTSSCPVLGSALCRSSVTSLILAPLLAKACQSKTDPRARVEGKSMVEARY